MIYTVLLQEGGWKCHNKYKGQDWLFSFLSMQQIYRCQLTVLAWYACHEAIAVIWHLYVCCILRKEVQQSCTLHLIWYFQPPPLSNIIIWVIVQFEWHFKLSNIYIWVTFQFEWHNNLSDIPIWGTFIFEWYFNLNDIPIWVTFQLSHIQIRVTFQFDWHSKLSDIPNGVTFQF